MSDFTTTYVVIKDFQARLNDELSITQGDQVELISDDSEFGDGWYMGKNLTTGKVGLYPKVFTKRIEKPVDLDLEMPPKPTLLRSRSRRTANQSPIDVSFNSSFDTSDSRLPPNISPTVERKGVHGYVNDIDKALKELSMDDDDSASQDINGDLNIQELDLWSPEQVAQYFTFHGFDIDTTNQFIKHKISGAILLELELSHLKELDINSFGTRYQIFKEIEELKKEATALRSNNSNTGIVQRQGPKTADFKRNSPNLMIDSFSNDNDNNNDNGIIINKNEKSTSNEKTPDLDVETHDSFNDSTTNQFLSPRKPPQPPSYPSPVEEYPMNFGINSPEKDKVRYSLIVPHHIIQSGNHSRNSSFGGASSIYMDSTSQGSHDVGFTHKLEAAGNSISKRLSAVLNGSVTDFKEPQQPQYTSSSIPVNERRSVSAKELTAQSNDNINVKDSKRIQSTNTMLQKRPEMSSNSGSSSSPTPVSTLSTSKQPNTSTFRSLTQRKPPAKTQTSAFQEGIQNISVEDSIKTASYSGWMFKRGNLSIGSWKQRFFTLHKTRLSYFTSLKDSKEKGLIDITSHKVLPANEVEDKISAVYAATAGYGRYLFKLVPPAPGSRMGLTFTQQKVHYFAVETKEEMREWMAALMKATIEVDETVPVISSCVTPTIPLQKAQELMAIARENAQENLENLQRQREEQLRGNMINNEDFDSPTNLTSTTDDINNETRSSTLTNQSSLASSTIPRTTGLKNGISQLVNNNNNNNNNASGTSTPLNGMSTPYLVTSGLIAPNVGSGSIDHGPTRTVSMKQVPPIVTRLDPVDRSETTPPPLSHSNSFRRVLSLRRNRD